MKLRFQCSFFQCASFWQTNFRGAVFQCFLFFASVIFFAVGASAQNLDLLAEQIRRGNSEQKRDALRVIRNAKTAEASRIAIAALRDSSEIVRATATFSVIYLPPDEALLVLTPLLSDKKELVRREAVYALGKTRNASTVNILIERFRRDKIAEVKNAAVVALGDIGDASAIDFLIGILRAKPKSENEADDFLRRAAARSIGQIAQAIQTGKIEVTTPENSLPENSVINVTPNFADLIARFPVFRSALPVLIGVVQNLNETNDARREAAFALGAIGDRSAIPILQANLTNEDYYLAEISRQALRKIELSSLRFGRQ